MPTYYDILEVAPDASEEDIKRAYRRLALLYHPDLSQQRLSDRDFREIQSAYETLSDAETRELYDKKHGFLDDIRKKLDAHRKQEEKIKKTQMQSDEEWIAQVIEQRNSSARHAVYTREPKEKSQPQKDTKRRPVSRDHGPSNNSPPIEQSKQFEKNTVRIFLDKLKDGVLGGAERSKSSVDNFIEDAVEVFFPREQGKNFHYCTIDALESLNGTTREITIQENGRSVALTVKIPKGVHSDRILQVNTRLRPGDPVYVLCHITSHPLVEREGSDVIVKLPITVSEAIQGTELLVPTMDGCLRVSIPPGWNETRRLRLKGRGVFDSHLQKQGDLYVKTPIVLPENLGDVGEKASKMLDALYDKDIRAHVPRSLSPSGPSR